MQVIAFFLSFLMLFQIMQAGFPVSAAAPVQFTPSGTGKAGALNAEIPITQVGKLKINNGTAVIRGNTIDVVGTLPGQGTKQSLLSGVVVKTEMTTSGKSAQVKGIAYFRQGAAIEALDALSQNAEDIIDTIDGGTYYGKIVSINRDEVEFEDRQGVRRRFAMSDIKAIRGPRVLTFTVPIILAATIVPGSTSGTPVSGTGGQATFSATGGARPPVPPTGTTGGQPGFLGTTLGKVIVGTVVLAGVATAIVVPVAIGVHNAHERHRRNEERNRQLMLLYNAILRNNQVPQTSSPQQVQPIHSSP